LTDPEGRGAGHGSTSSFLGPDRQPLTPGDAGAKGRISHPNLSGASSEMDQCQFHEKCGVVRRYRIGALKGRPGQLGWAPAKKERATSEAPAQENVPEGAPVCPKRWGKKEGTVAFGLSKRDAKPGWQIGKDMTGSRAAGSEKKRTKSPTPLKASPPP